MKLLLPYGYLIVERLVLMQYDQIAVNFLAGCSRLCSVFIWAMIT